MPLARRRRHAVLAAAAVMAGAVCGASNTARAFDFRFDVCTFVESAEFSENHLRQAHFDRLNFVSPNGHQIMMGTDAHRPELNAAGNVLGVYHNSLTQVYTDSAHNPTVAADIYHQYAVTNHGNTGAVPQWISMNEISSSLWQNSAEYRGWLAATVARLHDFYGHEMIVFSPFSNPLNPDRAPDWQAIASKAYIGVENFLSGEEVRANGYSVTWAQNQYKVSLDSYMAKGVDPSRVMLTEYFAHTLAGTGYGRAGVPIDEWQRVINVRSDAIRNVGFAGFIGYAWSHNQMHVSDAEMYAAIESYRSHITVESEGPQWNKDASGAWLTAANWTSPYAPVPPNAMSEVANFVKPLTAPRSITLDSPIIIGRITFSSANAYTLAPSGGGGGGGGSIVFSNNGLPGSITVTSGAHVIAAPLTLSDSVDLKIAGGGGLSITGSLTNQLGRALTKTGAGALTISGLQTHGPNSVLNANAGVTTLASSGGPNLSVNARAAVNFSSSQRLGGLMIFPDIKLTLTPGSAKTLSLATLSLNGTLDLGDNDMILRNGGETGRAAVSDKIKFGHDTDWSGPGIVTSQPSAANGLTTLGVALASSILGISGSQTATWNGQGVSANDVLVMYTYAGDANLDGTIDGGDYGVIDNFVQVPGASGYSNADFNYDGVINGGDYGIIDNNIQAQGAPLSTSGAIDLAGIVPVPEAASGLMALGVLGAGLATQRRRRRRIADYLHYVHVTRTICPRAARLSFCPVGIRGLY